MFLGVFQWPSVVGMGEIFLFWTVLSVSPPTKGGALCFWAHFSDRTFGDFQLAYPGFLKQVQDKLWKQDSTGGMESQKTVSGILVVGIFAFKGGGLMVSSPICLSILFDVW